MQCSICGRYLPFEDDAIEKLIDAGVQKSAMSLLSDHHHLNPHPEHGCPGDPEALDILKIYANKESQGGSQ